MLTYRRRDAWLPLSFTWLAFALRVYHLGYQSLWRDEVDTLRFALRDLPALLTAFRKSGENGPLFFLALKPWLAMAGQTEFALRFPSALAGALSVPAIYVIAHRLVGRGAALVAALLTATAPYLVWYGQEAKMYALLVAIVPVSLWLTVRAAQKGGWWRWAFLYGLTSLGCYTHVLAALVIPVQVVWLLLIPSGARPTRRLATVGCYLALLVMPYLPMLWWQAWLWLSPTFQTGHAFVPLPGIVLALAIAFTRGVLPTTRAMWLATLMPAALALVAGVALGVFGWGVSAPVHGTPTTGPSRPTGTGGGHISARRAVALLLIWLALPVVAIYGVSLGMPIFTDRYLIWIMPAFLALVGLGTVTLARLWRPVGLAMLGAFLALNVAAVAAQASRPIKSDFRAAAAFVMQHRQPGDVLMFQIPHIRYAFTYYLEGRTGAMATPDALPLAEVDASGARDAAQAGRLLFFDGPYTNAGMSSESVAGQMARKTQGAPAVWLIASEVPLWDTRHIAEDWLAVHGSATDHAELARVTVTRYRLER